MFCANVGSKTPVSFLFLIVTSHVCKNDSKCVLQIFFYDKLIERGAIFEDVLLVSGVYLFAKIPQNFQKSYRKLFEKLVK